MNERRVHVGLAVVLALSGFLMTAASIQERRREEASPQRRAELQALVEQRRAAIDELSHEVDRLTGELEDAQASAAGAALQDLRGRVADLRRAAGLEPVRGPGIAVRLSDSPREPRTREELTDLHIQDVDLQLVVNVLWRAGAEAVAVNDRRLVSTTAIRKAGSSILVNYRAVSSPYRVVAIGDPDRLREVLDASEIARRFDVWREVYGLGFEVQGADDLLVPALPGLEGIGFAQPAKEAG